LVFCLKSLVRIIVIGDMFRLRDPASSAAIAAAAAHAESGSSSDSEQENILLNIAEDGGGEGGGGGVGSGDSGPAMGESARTGKNIYNDDDIIRVDDDRYVFNPYNTENVDVTLADVESILARYGVPSQVHNFELYRRAFVHRSYTKRPKALNDLENITFVERPEGAKPLHTKSNERLEFVGDGVLECITKYYLYRRFPKENEGFMTEKKIAIVKNETIGKFALEMGLHRWFIISKHSEEKKTRTNLKKLGCLFEAFVGALFLDFNHVPIHDEDKWFDRVFTCGPGFQVAQIFIETVFEQHIDWTNLIKNDDNYKNILQVKIQKEFKTTPDYIELSRDADAGYEMGLYLCLGQPLHEVIGQPSAAISFGSLSDGFAGVHRICEQNGGKAFIFFARASHKIKKKAEQITCEMAIRQIARIAK
jgi:dsRNA-specific ribonuclease